MRLVLTCCVSAVVATEAIVGDVDVIEVRRNPRDGRVAVVAVVAARDVRRVLARCCSSIVAGAAGTDNLCVVHLVSRHECHVVVTVLADVGGLDMCRVLARGINAVVTAEAVVDNTRVIEIGRYPCRGRMTIIAVVTAIDMRWVLAFCNRAVVTGIAGANNLQVVDPVCRNEENVVVAVLAQICRLNMHRAFSDRIRAVVTTEAVTRDIDMIEIRRNPANGRMAVIAGVATSDMCRILAFGDRAVVAGVTRTDNLGVIYLVCGSKNGSVMAVITRISGVYMRRILACSNASVVTGTARADHLCMVHLVCWSERHIVVAVFTNAACLDMRRILAGSIHTVMAAEAVVDDVRMIESGRSPACGCVAVVAGITTGDMCQVLAFGNRAVVAGVTGTNHVGMVHPVRWCENGNVVAVLTNISGLNMRRDLAGRIHAIVTAEAVIADIDMLDVGRSPARCRMAVIAGIAATYMGGVLAFGDRSVVTGAAGTYYLSVIHPVRRCEGRTVMTVFTNVGRLDMCRILAGRSDTVMA